MLLVWIVLMMKLGLEYLGRMRMCGIGRGVSGLDGFEIIWDGVVGEEPFLQLCCCRPESRVLDVESIAFIHRLDYSMLIVIWK